MAFIKAGDKSWRHVKSHHVEIRGGIPLTNSISDITRRRSKVKILAPRMDPPTYSIRAYLVGSSYGRDHFYVQRNLDHTLQHTTHFKVYKLRLGEQSGEVMDRIE
ncbi:hypothetical protein CFP56_034261, partial [Quercus suber]